ncbi:MAG: hypothetical protein LBR53_12590 [Deltaproteobacteria bacterium]|jgi:hypothetical protein|nr:hypothetical protein [Deltaproteobacteria bacterium]
MAPRERIDRAVEAYPLNDLEHGRILPDGLARVEPVFQFAAVNHVIDRGGRVILMVQAPVPHAVRLGRRADVGPAKPTPTGADGVRAPSPAKAAGAETTAADEKTSLTDRPLRRPADFDAGFHGRARGRRLQGDLPDILKPALFQA